MSVEVVVTKVLWQGPTGVIFSGTLASGARRTVRLSEAIYPVPGEVYRINGAESDYVDRRGATHRQITARGADRVRTSGALLGPWLRSLPGIGAERASWILERFSGAALEALDDPLLLNDLAACLSPGRPALGLRLATIIQAHYAAMRAV